MTAQTPGTLDTRHSTLDAIDYPPARGIHWRAIWGIIRKDLRVVFQSKSVVLPMIIVPLILLVIIPAGMGIAINIFGPRMMQSADFAEILDMVPASMREGPYGNNPLQLATLFLLRSMFAPLYLILPIMTASVVAADAFAGEKERKTLEALLYTPTTDFDLLLSKLLGALIPAVLVAWASALVYWLVVDLVAFPIFGRPILPDVTWLLLALWVAPAAAAMALGATVLVSSRAKSFQDAYQISGLVVLPVVILMLGQTLGIFFLSPLLTFLVGLLFFAAAAVLVVIGANLLKRQEILARL